MMHISEIIKLFLCGHEPHENTFVLEGIAIRPQ